MFRRLLNGRMALLRLVPVACLLAAYLGLAGQGIMSAAAQDARKLTINQTDADAWPNVTINLSLTGPDGKAVPNVDLSQFKVEEQGKPQGVLELKAGQAKEVPLSLVLTTDISGSMNADKKLAQAKEAADTFLASLRPEDKVSLVAFNDKVQEIVPFTSDLAAVKAGVNALAAGGNTAIYDALYKSSQIVSSSDKGRRRVIILLTDGVDTSSKYAPAVAANIAKQSGALVYTIGLGPDANDTALTRLAEPGGGKYYKAPSAADLNGIYNTISLELNSQLFLKYHSQATIERQYQLVEVALSYTAPDGQVVVKTFGYRPPPEAVVRATDVPFVLQTFATPVVSLPPGLVNQGQASTSQAVKKTPTFPVNVLSIGAIVLGSVAIIMGAIGMGVVMMPSPTSGRIERYLMRVPVSLRKEDRRRSFVVRRISSLVEAGGKRIIGLSPKNYIDLIGNLITLMGPPYRMTVGGFLGIQLLLSALSVGLLSLIIAGSDSPAPAQWLLGAIVALGVGAYLPYFWLKRRVARRQKAVLRSLPGALDFLAINVEAGLGFDAALAQVVKRWQNTLTDEFAMLLIDFRIGKARKDAWRDLLRRTQVQELTTFVTAMLQNEQVGISISTLLRIQAEQLRIRRRQIAEESARTAPVKMLLPMVFFIFPGIFVIILGPAIPQFLDTFTHIGR